MLVTHTEREIVPMLPRFRIVAVSMQRLQIGRARIVVISIDMVYLDSVVMLEAQPAVATTPVLLFEQLCQS
jgi:hypothetical protein